MPEPKPHSLGQRAEPTVDRSYAREEGYLKIKEAAERLKIHVWALRRAVKRGLVPSYCSFNSRRLVKLSEVIAAIEATKIGGGE